MCPRKTYNIDITTIVCKMDLESLQKPLKTWGCLKLEVILYLGKYGIQEVSFICIKLFNVY
jgi:hypothetical protein